MSRFVAQQLPDTLLNWSDFELSGAMPTRHAPTALFRHCEDRHTSIPFTRPLVIDVSDPAQMGRSMLNLLQYQVAGVVVTSGSPPPEVGVMLNYVP